MAEKHPPCCARLIGKLHHDESNLAALARKAAFAEARGYDITKYRALIAGAKASIAEAKKAIDNHEADHAEERIPA